MPGYVRKYLTLYRKKLNEHPIISDVGEYWLVYGGWKALLCSPWAWIALIGAVIFRDESIESGWCNTATSVMPNVLGFSVGTMAIVLAFPSTTAFRYFKEAGRRDSFYMDLVATLTHFILIQVLCLIIAVIAPFKLIHLLNFIGFWLFLYSILSAAGVAITLFGVARLYNRVPDDQ